MEWRRTPGNRSPALSSARCFRKSVRAAISRLRSGTESISRAMTTAGFVAHTLIGQRLVNLLESSLLSKIPAYDYLKQESASALGVAEIGELPLVFVPMEGGWQLGVQTEALSNGLVSIFVPGAPNPHSGSVFFFSTDTVRPAGIKLAAGLNCLRRCGAGASALGANWPSDKVQG